MRSYKRFYERHPTFSKCLTISLTISYLGFLGTGIYRFNKAIDGCIEKMDGSIENIEKMVGNIGEIKNTLVKIEKNTRPIKEMSNKVDEMLALYEIESN